MSPVPRPKPPYAVPLPIIAILIAAAALLTPGRAAAQADSAALLPAYRLIDRFVEQRRQEAGTPGVAYGITDRQGLLRVGVAGYADLERRRLLTPADRFEIGSISKSFTAIALLQLEAEGRFDPKKPITTYLPWLTIKSSWRAITGHDLLTHTSGIPQDRDDIPSSVAQAYFLRERTPGSPPGDHFAYSNIGYQTLGTALARLEKTTVAEVVERRVLKPLGMNASAAQFTNADRPSLAIGYQGLYDDRPPRPGEPLVIAPWGEYGSGDGGIIATPADLAAYARVLLNRGQGPMAPILDSARFAELTKPRVSMDPRDSTSAWYGYGLDIERWEGHQVIGHGGGMLGYSTHILADMDEGIGVVTFVNGPGDTDELGRFILRALRAARHAQPLPELPPPNDPSRVEHAPDFAGVYTNSAGATLEFTADSQRLYLSIDGRRQALEAWGSAAVLGPVDRFPLFPLRFRRTAGQVTEVDYGGDWYVNQRYNGPHKFSYPAAWNGYTGHYRIMQPWEPDFRVILRRDALIYVGPEGGEERLTPAGPGRFRIGESGSAEFLVFDQVVDGKALRATLSGMAYYRFFTP
jgi:CubicO group peptidase (beta-lactamase class C family)